MSECLKVGIAGCGEVAQILHLPSLAYLPDLYRVTALCDVSRAVLDAVGSRLPWARRTTDVDELVSGNDVDIVLVASPNVFHADTALKAIAAGKHVLIEKPMCITEAEAEALAVAEKEKGVVVMVGYMRRYAPAFERAVREVATMEAINFARVHTVIGPNAAFIEPSSKVARGTDIPKTKIESADKALAKKLSEALGTDDPLAHKTYSLLLGLSSHDISAMRELIGQPKRVLHATRAANPTFLTVAFDYGDFVCQFETGIDQIARFDSYLAVYAQDRVVEVKYDTPYIRNQRTAFALTAAEGRHGLYRTTGHDTLEDNFVIEWRRLHDHIVNGSRPKSNIDDARQDLRIFRDIMAALA
ncbi:putative Oxidoreductase [uncultured Pleomorphomonas sp.]|uniref:Putative Oxidoreductase n=1 Tax=uncultured Pleomorphomonas sp. TaxID=442121 RepID=A0A212LBQ5_9HYPH|nr:Gfo/Idh/MocA family oxidoreductase [uncultured Pleomorphomonas sp.]SCM74975.1 putative Oxidoreductase [uncultured Pleomorphomonas sp.]